MSVFDVGMVFYGVMIVIMVFRLCCFYSAFFPGIMKMNMSELINSKPG